MKTRFTKPFTTSFGRVIRSGLLDHIADLLDRGMDWQQVINDELREPIPEHPDDMDEALEVIRHCEEAVQDEHDAKEASIAGEEFIFGLPPNR